MNADAIYIHSSESCTGSGDTPNLQTADSRLTLGSLFDGSGGFPLGRMHGSLEQSYSQHLVVECMS